ncbi:MAG: drug/metabolite transporter (DMT)-like permease [Bacteriovoracaceae bacterium]
MTPSKLNPVVLVLIFIQILFGVNFPASKVIVGQMDPILWSNIRFILAGIGMLGLTLAMRRPHPKLNKEFLIPVSILSILGLALGQGLFLIGLRYTTSINSAILITCIPILTLLIVVIRKQEQLTFNKFVGFVMSFMGVLLMRDVSSFELGNETLWGDLLVFLAAFCFAIYLSYGKKFFMKFDNMWSTTWMFFISGIAMSLFNFDKFSQITSVDYSMVFFYCAGFSIVGATLLTYFLNNWALKRAPSGNVAIFIYLQPVVAGLIGFFFLKEEISMRMVICSGLILAGLLFSISKKS